MLTLISKIMINNKKKVCVYPFFLFGCFLYLGMKIKIYVGAVVICLFPQKRKRPSVEITIR